MTYPTFTIIVPTISDPRLSRTLWSIDKQLGEDDEVLVIGDGVQKFSRWMCSRLENVIYLDGPETHCWGNEQRNFGMLWAAGDFLIWIDEDDILFPDFLLRARTILRQNPDKPHMFRFDSWAAGLVWRQKEVVEGNVGGHCLVAPNKGDRLGKWGNRYQGDFDFIKSTLVHYPEEDVIWREELIAITRPERLGSNHEYHREGVEPSLTSR